MNKLIRVIKYYIPSKEALRNTEVTISTIQDLYNQCMEFINYLGDVAIQLSREGDGYNGKYRSLEYEGYVYQYSDNNSWYIENAGGDMYVITPDIATGQIYIRFDVD